MDNPNSERSTKALFAGNAGWALVTGLAVGFAIGQSVGRWSALEQSAVNQPGTTTQPAPAVTSGAGSPSASPTATSLTPPVKPSTRVYTSVTEFPPGWLKAADIPAGVLDGLTEPQTVSALQVLNERNCECGCRFGTLAACLKHDPGCPRSPVLAGMIVSMARTSQPVASILDAVDVSQTEMNQAKKARGDGRNGHQHDAGRRKVELSAWNPRKGPAAAKVTIVEFSDFQ